MKLYGWKYEGRKIADKLHEQILSIVEILNNPSTVGTKDWPELQKYISVELGIATGQVRTIKRMMEEFDIIRRGSLGKNIIPDCTIFSENGKILIELIGAEQLMRENMTSDNLETIQDIREIYRLYYQKVLTAYSYNNQGELLHPLRATLKALKRFDFLNYWEWYILNTVIRNDDDKNEEEKLRQLIEDYRSKKITFSDSDLVENQLSHSYVLGNFEYTGLVCTEGSKYNLKITANEKYQDVIDEIIR